MKKVLEEAGAKKQKLKTLGKNIKEQAENIVLVPLEIVGVVAFFGILGFQYVTCTGDGLFNPGCMWK